jgi:hypothetical protein
MSYAGEFVWLTISIFMQVIEVSLNMDIFQNNKCVYICAHYED